MLVAVAAIVAFGAGVMLMIGALREPVRPVEYFLAGVVGTLFALAVLFLTLVRFSNLRNVFYKKRARPARAARSSTLGLS